MATPVKIVLDPNTNANLPWPPGTVLVDGNVPEGVSLEQLRSLLSQSPVEVEEG